MTLALERQGTVEAEPRGRRGAFGKLLVSRSALVGLLIAAVCVALRACSRPGSCLTTRSSRTTR